MAGNKSGKSEYVCMLVVAAGAYSEFISMGWFINSHQLKFKMQVIANPHHLLVTLLLCNAASMEALPVFLDRLLNPVAAILISVTAILTFGEILPQAVCKRYGLQVGAYLSWLVQILMVITFPISWPVGKLLDWLLGQETALFRRPELREFVTLHAEGEGSGRQSMLTTDEVQVIHGALDMANKTAEAAMTPLAKVFSINADAPLDRDLLERIIEAGHSRVPVYEGSNRRHIIGLILVKELVLVDTARKARVRDCGLREIDYILANTPLYATMELFRLKRRHMAVLTRPTEASGRGPGVAPNESEDGEVVKSGLKQQQRQVHPVLGVDAEVVGIITIEDVIEELLQHEIVDETDVYVDNLQTEAVNPVPTTDISLPPELVRYLSKRKRTVQALTGRRSGGQPVAIAAAANAAIAASRQQGQRPNGPPMNPSVAWPTVPGGATTAENRVMPLPGNDPGPPGPAPPLPDV